MGRVVPISKLHCQLHAAIFYKKKKMKSCALQFPSSVTQSLFLQVLGNEKQGGKKINIR